MLTRKQHELLMFIHERIKETGVSPSFDEMKEALDLASKSGIHRLITALEERGFIRRLAHRARALEVVKLPEQATAARGRQPFRPDVIEGGGRPIAAELFAEAERFGMDALIETHDETEMARACKLGGDLVGINNRSLRTFEVDLEVTERLAMLSPVRALLVAESGIFTPDDVARVSAAHAQAVLVGESLMRQADVEAATRALLR